MRLTLGGPHHQGRSTLPNGRLAAPQPGRRSSLYLTNSHESIILVLVWRLSLMNLKTSGLAFCVNSSGPNLSTPSIRNWIVKPFKALADSRATNCVRLAVLIELQGCLRVSLSWLTSSLGESFCYISKVFRFLFLQFLSLQLTSLTLLFDRLILFSFSLGVKRIGFSIYFVLGRETGFWTFKGLPYRQSFSFSAAELIYSDVLKDQSIQPFLSGSNLWVLIFLLLPSTLELFRFPFFMWHKMK